MAVQLENFGTLFCRFSKCLKFQIKTQVVFQAKTQGTIFLLNWIPGGGEEEGDAEDLDGVGCVGPTAYE